MKRMAKQTSQGRAGDQSEVLRALTRSKLHIAPGTLAQASGAIGDCFASPWAPVEELGRQLQGFGIGLLRYWAVQERGHVLIGPSDHGYLPGQQQWGRRQLDGVAFVSVVDLARASRRPLALVAHMLDHLLGCAGTVDGPWLSDGGGTTAGLREVGQRVRELHRLGYGRSQEAQRDVHEYFAEALVDCCLDRRALNVADPQMEGLLSRTLLNEAFWRAMTEDG